MPDETGHAVDVRGNVQTVRVPPDRETLKLIAERTGGQYFEAPTAEDLEKRADAVEDVSEAEADRLEAEAKRLQKERDVRD